MKKIILLISALFAISSGIYAQDSDSAEKSRVEQIMLKKGTLIHKEFIPLAKFNDVEGEIMKVTDVKSGNTLYGLRLSHYYYNSKYDSGESTSFVDINEIDSILATLEYVKKTLPTFGKDTPYNEIAYKSTGGMTIGAYHSDGKSNLFIKFDYKDKKYMNTSELDKMITFFMTAKTKLNELGIKF